MNPILIKEIRKSAERHAKVLRDLRYRAKLQKVKEPLPTDLHLSLVHLLDFVASCDENDFWHHSTFDQD